MNVQAEVLRSIEAVKVLSTVAADADTIKAAIVSGVVMASRAPQSL